MRSPDHIGVHFDPSGVGIVEVEAYGFDGDSLRPFVINGSPGTGRSFIESK